MDRAERLQDYIRQHDNINFNASNIPRVLENLKKADADGRLKEFFLNKKPYQSAFAFFVFEHGNWAARGKDQCAIVFALNIYGASYPGFVFRLHRVLRELAQGNSKEVSTVLVLRNAQLELQQLEISLIDFFDRDLLMLLNSYVTKNKPSKILLMLLCMIGGAIGAPGCAIAGLVILSPVCAGIMIYGFIKLVYWIAIRPLDDATINAGARLVAERYQGNV